MPVPVPRAPDNPQQSICILPVAASALPPSFGTREQWINSLPSWRRTKPRRIWEEDSRFAEQAESQLFPQGLAVAKASAIKGQRAHACIPPMNAHLHSVGLDPFGHDLDDEMAPDDSGIAHCRRLNSYDQDMNVDFLDEQDASDPQDCLYERGAFTPIFEDDSPELCNMRDPSTSPIEPVTPFTDCVDRAVASCGTYAGNLLAGGESQGEQAYCNGQVEDSIPSDLVATPSATTTYKRLADPLSAWVAAYVWKVCTTGMTLPAEYVQCSIIPQVYGSSPPVYLAGSVHSLLLSTLLQPSAVFLAIWYIVHLPVTFDAPVLGADRVKEQSFRSALFGDCQLSADRDAAMGAPYRLIVLGCMLANKWLDDHTFSNKTWHTISNIPIQSLNTLESLTLDIFSYDLNISRRDWSQWLSHVMEYHMSLTLPSHPQPISRPSANPHSIVRKAIQDIMQTPAMYSDSADPQPVFLGLDERRREKISNEQASTVDVSDIDLDEDGPLRQEYLPKRRISAAATSHEPIVGFGPRPNAADWRRRAVTDTCKPLPPPAKWSPAGDEPILRDRNRLSGHYVAVQAPPAPFEELAQPMYFPQHDMAYISQGWPVSAAYAGIKPSNGFYEAPLVHVASQPRYNPYPFALPVSHARTQSLSYEHDTNQPRDRSRSFSQSRFEYRPSDIRMHANQLAPLHSVDNSQWAHYGQHPSMFGTSSQWLRT